MSVEIRTVGPRSPKKNSVTLAVGMRVLKSFGDHGVFEGKVDRLRTEKTEGGKSRTVAHVVYTDGDEEEMYGNIVVRLHNAWVVAKARSEAVEEAARPAEGAAGAPLPPPRAHPRKGTPTMSPAAFVALSE